MEALKVGKKLGKLQLSVTGKVSYSVFSQQLCLCVCVLLDQLCLVCLLWYALNFIT